MSEEFRFNQLTRYSRAVQCDEWPGGTRAPLMNGPRNQLFARARFSQNANSALAGRHPLQLRHHAAHDLALPDNFMLAQPVSQLSIFALESLQLKHILNREQ